MHGTTNIIKFTSRFANRLRWSGYTRALMKYCPVFYIFNPIWVKADIEDAS